MTLPFALRNKSIWPMNKVAMTCGVDLYYFADANGLTGLLRDSQFNNQVISIGRGAPTNYTCDASNYVRFTNIIRFCWAFPAVNLMKFRLQAISGRRLKIIKMCLYMKGAYSLGSFTSSMFQWPQRRGSLSGLKGLLRLICQTKIGCLLAAV